MMRNRRTLAALALGGTSLVALPALAADCPAGYPNGPVEMVVGYAAGGGTDAITRSIAAEIEKATIA